MIDSKGKLETADYTDPITERIIDFFNEQGPAKLKDKYYFGDPNVIAQNQLNFPICCISLLEENNTRETNTHIKSILSYRATVVTDMKEKWLKGKNIVAQQMYVQALVAGRDADMNMAPGTLQYVLWTNRVIDGSNRLYLSLGNATRPRFRPNTEGRGRGMYTYEGYMDFMIEHNEPKPTLPQ